MIKNVEVFEEFEKNFVRERGNLPFKHAMKLFSDMWNEGLRLGVLPPKELLDSIDVDIRIAKVLNSCLKKSSPR
jgi:hypothetical protein